MRSLSSSAVTCGQGRVGERAGGPGFSSTTLCTRLATRLVFWILPSRCGTSHRQVEGMKQEAAAVHEGVQWPAGVLGPRTVSAPSLRCTKELPTNSRRSAALAAGSRKPVRRPCMSPSPGRSAFPSASSQYGSGRCRSARKSTRLPSSAGSVTAAARYRRCCSGERAPLCSCARARRWARGAAAGAAQAAAAGQQQAGCASAAAMPQHTHDALQSQAVETSGRAQQTPQRQCAALAAGTLFNRRTRGACLAAPLHRHAAPPLCAQQWCGSAAVSRLLARCWGCGKPGLASASGSGI